MRKTKQHQTTPAELTREVHEIGARLPELDDMLERIEPEVAVARALGDDARVAFVEDRMARLRAERVDLERRHGELLATMRVELDRQLTDWQRKRWEPAMQEIRAERARRVAECVAAGEAFAAALERLKSHPGEVQAEAEALLFGERSDIEFSCDSVRSTVAAPGFPLERELSGADFDRAVAPIRALLQADNQMPVTSAGAMFKPEIVLATRSRFTFR